METVEGNGTRNGKRGLLPLLAAALVAAGIIPASERAAAQGGAAVALPVRAPRPAPATPLEMALRLERELARGAGRLMPDPERRLALDGGLIPLDDAGGEFPDDFLAGLVPEEADGIEVWRVVLNVDDSTGGVLFYNASGGLFWSVAADVGVWSADWIARLHSPDGTAADFSGIEARCGELLAKPSRAEWSDLALYHAAWLDTRQFFQPSHVEMAFTFILQEDLEAFRSAGSAAGAQAAAGAPMAAPASPAGLAATGIEAGTNGVALSAAWPTNTVIAGGALDIFFSRTLAPPAWTNLWQVEVNPVAGGVDIVIPRSELPPPPEIPAAAYTTNIAASAYDPDVVYTNIICTNAAWMVDSGFFRLADLADSDGDGITDAGEKWMHGTRFDLADSDGDGMPDGWEVANGLDPLAADALSDPDNDRAPAVYEFHHGTNPNCPDSHLIPTLRVDPAAAATNASSHASIRAAFAASAPYSVIEVADGLYSGRANAGLWFPAHPVLLMSEDWGASRLATVTYDGNLAAFYMNARQDNRTIVRGLNLRLGGATPYQIGFWLGDGPPIAPDKGAAPVFEGVTVELGASDVNVGFFCRHSAPGAVRFENCVIRGKRGAGKSMRGIYAIDSPALRLVNCTFLDFSPSYAAYGIQFESTTGNFGSADNPVAADLVNCVWDESFAHPDVHAFVRLQRSAAYHVGMTRCLVPRALDWFPPDACSGLLVANARLATDGHLRGGSPAIDAGCDAAPPLDFEGQARDAAPDIGADEYAGFAAGDSDGDGIGDAVEVETCGTSPYETDSDGDSVGDADELADGTDPADPRSVNRPVSVAVANRFSQALTNIVSYAFDDAPAMGAHTVTQFAGNASFSFPFSFAPGTSLWVKAACDMDRDGVIDPAAEPVYGALFLTFFPRVSIEIGDFDGDGVNDWLENQYGSSPTNPASCHVTVGGAITNLYSDIFTNHVTWGLSASGWNESNAVRIVKEGGFQFPSVPANSARSIYVKAFCDLDGDGIRDAATEPLYVACVTDFARPTVSICINDFDRDGVPDNEEVAEGTDPADGNNYCFSASGVFTNKLWLETDVRLAFERVEDTVVTTLVDFAPTNGPFALPHVSTTVPVAWRLRCYNDDDGDHACGTNEFSRVYHLVRRHHDVRCNITVDDRTFDTDGDGMSDLWERLYDAVAIGVPDALEDPDGDLLVNLHECWSGTDPGIADVTTNTSALANAAFAIDSRIAGKDPAVALPLFENYLANGADGVFLRNTNCWAADLDLTCCSPWNSCENNEKAGTLISPRHVLFAAHHALPAGCFVYFVDRQNNVITRKLVAKRQHPRYSGPSMHAYDITVGLLDADVPTNQISFARVLPDNYADYIRTGARLPAIRLDQEEKALVGDLWNVTASDPRGTSKFQSPADPSRYSFYERVIGGDSGNPALIVVSGEPVLLTVWTFGEAGSGTSVAAIKDDINRLMSDLGGGYQLTEVDLAGFTPLP
ncbi:MAG: choice-of-anchor Q domain-containing protein [Kiritimatiellia bacterium]